MSRENLGRKLSEWYKWLFSPLGRMLIFPFANLPTVFALGVLLLLLVLILPGFYGTEGAGFGQFGTLTDTYFQRAKTFWDWMELLIVPVILAMGALWFNSQTRERDVERTNDRFKEEALQKYFDSMAELLLKTEVKPEQISDVATMRTVTVLRRLDSERRSEVLDFLRVSAWLSGETAILQNAIMTKIDLSNADLENANLSGADLNLANLSNALLNGVLLNGADLSGADLSGADLIQADLIRADLNGAELYGADLYQADLREANLEASLLDKATRLPDGGYWESSTDMARYTNPKHKDFWQPERAK